jgi:energy-coupling factor transport system ATP-binding protein
MIRFDHVTFTYAEAPEPALRDVDLHIPGGELWLVIGETGSGKSTLLQAINGLVPHFTGGELLGSVEVDGLATSTHPPRELAGTVGMVGQDPDAGFVTDVVEDELAYTMENLGVAPAVMRRRVEDVLDLLNLHPLRTRALASLSSGQKQRVAIGSALTASPRVLVLDEPTSALDPGAAEEVLAALTRLVHDLGITVVTAEHRLERVLQYADRVAVVEGGRVSVASPAEAMVGASVVPPVVALGRAVGWSPLPLSVRDARRLADGLRARLPVGPVVPPHHAPDGDPGVVVLPGAVVASTSRLGARYGPVVALRDVSLDVRAGEVLAVMGRNGAGKSTLLAHLAGLREPTDGKVTIDGQVPHRLKAKDLVRRVALVPADPGLLLYAETIDAECRGADRDSELEPGTTRAAVERIVPGLDPAAHPRDVSEGQRLGVALGVVLAPAPPLVLLDEPTRGLDYVAKARLVEILRELSASGHAVVMATHDVELVAEVARRVVVLADGELVADGPAREVVCHSPIFAPQVAKVLAPDEWLTVAEVEAALAS